MSCISKLKALTSAVGIDLWEIVRTLTSSAKANRVDFERRKTGGGSVGQGYLEEH